MGSVLVVLEVRGGKVRPASMEALGAARTAAELTGGGTVTALATDAAEVDASALGAAGADQVLVANTEQHSSDGAAATAARVAREIGAGAVFLTATIRGRDLLGRIAALLNTGFVPDCIELGAEGGKLHFVRPVFAGKALIRVRINGPVAVASFRPNFFRGAGRSATAAIQKTTAEPGKAVVTGLSGERKGRPDVAEATKIISGGRGMGGPENWHLIEAVADAVPGMATGASRAVVDAGWRPHEEQVGQTGKTVSPELYIAAGISGAIQHLAGMSTSKVIVAINKDKEAPIFQHATYGVVGDVHQVLPKLADELKKASSP
ncbi:MAG: electron transfer flavoprotein subunit alpha/FixB family protein [Planctomycetota bacterium]|nr:MAG: electron transfer flavoprotein subunit alpha/FixB family protein [Planctomycetota bacterium]